MSKKTGPRTTGKPEPAPVDLRALLERLGALESRVQDLEQERDDLRDRVRFLEGLR